MRVALLVLFLFVLAAHAAFAQGGVNLYWNDCGGGPGAATDLTFACDTDTGDPFMMFLSVIPPVEVPQFVAAEARVFGLVNGPTLPPWWQTATGQCRQNATSVTCDPAAFGPLTCADIWAGASPLSVYDVSNDPAHGTMLIRIGAALAQPIALTAEMAGHEELVVGAIRISRAKSAGADACAGCITGACFSVEYCRLLQPAGVGDITVTSPAVNNWVQYNGGAGWYNCYVPAVNRTWGAIKTLYR